MGNFWNWGNGMQLEKNQGETLAGRHLYPCSQKQDEVCLGELLIQRCVFCCLCLLGVRLAIGVTFLFLFYSQWKYLWRVEQFQVSASEVLDGGRAGGKAWRSQSGQMPCGQPSARPACPPSLCVAGLRRQPVLGAPFVWATFRRSRVTGQQSGHDSWPRKPLKPQRAPPLSHLGPPDCDQTQPNSSKQSSKGRKSLFFRRH